MSFRFDNKSRTYRKILDEQDRVVATVQKKPQHGYDLFDADMHKVRDLPFSSFQGALNYFKEMKAEKEGSAVKYTYNITGAQYYEVYKAGKYIGYIQRGTYWWNLYSGPQIELLGEGYPSFKESYAAFIEIAEGREPEPPSRPYKHLAEKRRKH